MRLQLDYLLLVVEDVDELIGKSTGSIHSGVINGLVHEIDGFIDEYQVGFKIYNNFNGWRHRIFWLND
jgi:type III pantothenate kinase